MTNVAPDHEGMKASSYVTMLRDHAAELESVAARIRALTEEVHTDPQHFYAEGLRLARTGRDAGQTAVGTLAARAHAEPSKLSIPRIANILGVSVSTARTMLPGKSPTKTTVTFDEF